MQDDIESFVKLKYEIITQDSETWYLRTTYPYEVRSKWAWRCAVDVEHLASATTAINLIRVAKAYRDGLATIEELNNADSLGHWNNTAAAFYYAATGNDAEASYRSSVASAWHHIDIDTTTYIDNNKNPYVPARDEKWKQYISWLIEELCEWELNHAE